MINGELSQGGAVGKQPTHPSTAHVHRANANVNAGIREMRELDDIGTSNLVPTRQSRWTDWVCDGPRLSLGVYATGDGEWV